MKHIIALILAYIIDLVIGDPKTWPHPVKGFGKLIYFFENKFNQNNYRRLKGTIIVIILAINLFLLTFFVVYFAYKIHWGVGIVIEAMIIATTIAQKSLTEAALDVYEPLQQHNLFLARKKLGEIVSRDTATLGEEEIVRGTIETVAENTSDGFTAPLFWAVIVGAPGAIFYRFVNTCDSMIGYKSDRYKDFGWFAAKLDDVINYIPARLTAFIIAFFNKRKLKITFCSLWTSIHKDAKSHVSPNSGYLEATFAYLLQVQLGGPNLYKGNVYERATMGTDVTNPQLLTAVKITEALYLLKQAAVLLLVFYLFGGILIDFTIPWLKP